MDAEQAYQAALDYLYSHIDYSLTHSFSGMLEKFDLGRMHAFLEALRSPHRQVPVIHVAGTKGKGSVSAMIASVYQASGRRAGLYTSPHLHDYVERIQINGQPIAHAALVSLVDEIRPLVEQYPGLTTFELTTALGFLYFARQQVDVAVIEVGLGGRLDATNVVTPVVSVITSLSLDHTRILGDTLAQIAAEKAGIIKPGRPVVSAPQQAEAMAVLVETAARQRAPLSVAGDWMEVRSLHHDLDGQDLELRWDDQRLRLRLPLLGEHQATNAATAASALLVAAQHGLPVSAAQIAAGLEQVRWPGRFELLRREPPLVIDSAHNRDSALRLRQTIADYLPGWPVILLFGASEDKDLDGMLTELLPAASRLYATQSIHPRAMPAEQIAQAARDRGCPAEAVLPLEAALQAALDAAGGHSAVVACGSLFIAAAVQEAWQAVAQANAGGSQPKGTIP